MKKLFGVMILAGFPVACGSTLPSGPDAVQDPSTFDASSATSQALRGRRPLPVPSCLASTSPSHIAAITIDAVEKGDGWVRVRAAAVLLGSDDNLPTACFAPVWALEGNYGRDVRLVTDDDPRDATLYAPAGKYSITASLNRLSASRVTGRIVVDVQ